MKIFVATVMLVALYFLYRIAYPKTEAKKGDDVPVKREVEGTDVVGKSLFVRPADSQSQTTHTMPLNTEKQEEKANIFVPGNGITDVVIPSDRLDEIFGEEEEEEFEQDDLDIPSDEDEEENESDNPDTDEEAEELRQVLERDAELATGFSIEEMEIAAKAIDSPTDESAEILYKIEKTDMFEQLVSGDEGKRQLISTVIDRHIRSLNPDNEIANTTDDSEYSNFNIAEYLR